MEKISSALFHKIVTSLEAILNSIQTDPQVFRWFSFLIVQPKLKSELSQMENVKKMYGEFENTMAMQRGLVVILCLMLLCLISLRHYLFLLPGLSSLFLWVLLQNRQKRKTKEIVRYLLSRDFKESELSQKTLFQICEIYSQKYHIPSLVDTIYSLDTISRLTIIGALILIRFIFPTLLNLPPLNMLQSIIFIAGSYYLILCLLNTNFVFKYLK